MLPSTVLWRTPPPPSPSHPSPHFFLLPCQGRARPRCLPCPAQLSSQPHRGSQALLGHGRTSLAPGHSCTASLPAREESVSEAAPTAQRARQRLREASQSPPMGQQQAAWPSPPAVTPCSPGGAACLHTPQPLSFTGRGLQATRPDQDTERHFPRTAPACSLGLKTTEEKHVSDCRPRQPKTSARNARKPAWSRPPKTPAGLSQPSQHSSFHTPKRQVKSGWGENFALGPEPAWSPIPGTRQRICPSPPAYQLAGLNLMRLKFGSQCILTAKLHLLAYECRDIYKDICMCDASPPTGLPLGAPKDANQGQNTICHETEFSPRKSPTVFRRGTRKFRPRTGLIRGPDTDPTAPETPPQGLTSHPGRRGDSVEHVSCRWVQPLPPHGMPARDGPRGAVRAAAEPGAALPGWRRRRLSALCPGQGGGPRRARRPVQRRSGALPDLLPGFGVLGAPPGVPGQRPPPPPPRHGHGHPTRSLRADPAEPRSASPGAASTAPAQAGTERARRGDPAAGEGQRGGGGAEGAGCAQAPPPVPSTDGRAWRAPSGRGAGGVFRRGPCARSRRSRPGQGRRQSRPGRAEAAAEGPGAAPESWPGPEGGNSCAAARRDPAPPRRPGSPAGRRASPAASRSLPENGVPRGSAAMPGRAAPANRCPRRSIGGAFGGRTAPPPRSLSAYQGLCYEAFVAPGGRGLTPGQEALLGPALRTPFSERMK